MPANDRALRVTNVYRERVRLLHARAQQLAGHNWTRHLDPADLDASVATFAAVTAPALTTLQIGAARLSSSYLAGYVAASTARPATIRGASASIPTGQSRAGEPLVDALAKPVITVKKAIATGAGIGAALAIGRRNVMRNAGEDFMFVARGSLFGGISEHEEIVGWRRVTGGGCGACMALADGTILPDDSDIEVHDNCQCSAEPVVRNVPDDVQRPTGLDMFDAMSAEAQDELLGADKAKLIRDGDVPFHALVARSPMDAIPNQITEAPLEALHAH